MKKITVFLLCLFPLAASATRLANCDNKPYDVTITNAGQTRVVTLHPNDAPIEEYGPVVTMQIPGDRPMVITGPHDEYCIWSGKIKIQQRNSDGGIGGSGGLR